MEIRGRITAALNSPERRVRLLTHTLPLEDYVQRPLRTPSQAGHHNWDAPFDLIVGHDPDATYLIFLHGTHLMAPVAGLTYKPLANVTGRISWSTLTRCTAQLLLDKVALTRFGLYFPADLLTPRNILSTWGRTESSFQYTVRLK